MNPITDEKKVLTLLRAAVVLVDEAETLHHQPLFYDREGKYVEITQTLKQTIKDLAREIQDMEEEKICWYPVNEKKTS